MIVQKCRICGNKLLKIFNFNKIALSGIFLRKEQINKEKKYPLSLTICKKCKHVQIQNIINPKILFTHYEWETGISESNIKLIKQLLFNINKKFKLNKRSKIFEIASNDGSLLKEANKIFKCNVLGIDPAKNLKKFVRKKNFSTIVDFFSYKKSKRIKILYGKFDFCIARNVIAHTLNPNDIFRGVFNLIKDSGIFVIEVPSLLNIYKDNQYDNIFHEHIGFHSLNSIQNLCIQNKLKIIDVEWIESQGGSLRCYISKNTLNIKKGINIDLFLKKEKRLGLLKLKNWIKFASKIKNHNKKMKIFLQLLKRKQYNISAYGASGKGQALMQFCNINHKLIDYVYDRSKFKQGKFTSGTHIKIIDPKFINKHKPDYILLLSWNIAKEIAKQEKRYLNRGGKIIIPFPNPHLLR